MTEYVQHHVKYKEIHGVDEVITMSVSDHVALHKKLRREEKCKIPAHKLHPIAAAAHNRTHQKFRFYDNVGNNISLVENVLYNTYTGKVKYNSYFEASNKKKLLIIQI